MSPLPEMRHAEQSMRTKLAYVIAVLILLSVLTNTFFSMEL